MQDNSKWAISDNYSKTPIVYVFYVVNFLPFVLFVVALIEFLSSSYVDKEQLGVFSLFPFLLLVFSSPAILRGFKKIPRRQRFTKNSTWFLLTFITMFVSCPLLIFLLSPVGVERFMYEMPISVFGIYCLIPLILLIVYALKTRCDFKDFYGVTSIPLLARRMRIPSTPFNRMTPKERQQYGYIDNPTPQQVSQMTYQTQQPSQNFGNANQPQGLGPQQNFDQSQGFSQTDQEYKPIPPSQIKINL